MSNHPSTAPPPLSAALAALAAEAESHPARSLESVDALAWVSERLRQIAAQASAGAEPRFCARCSHGLASTPGGMLN